MKVSRGRITSVLPEFLLGFGAHAADVDQSVVRLAMGGKTIELSIPDLGAVSAVRRLVWWDVHIQTTRGLRVVSGLSRADADQLVGAVRATEAHWWRSWFANNATEVERAAKALELLDFPPRYMSRSVFSRLHQEIREAYDRFPHNWETATADSVLDGSIAIQQLYALQDFLDEPEQRRTRANAVFVEQALQKSSSLFDSIATSPLTEDQRRAVVVDEDRNLVVAAAGSGKTSVIVAKAAWLADRQFRRPDEILLLAYNNSARAEIGRRIASLTNIKNAGDIAVDTFHRHGLSILKAVEPEAPLVATVASDQRALADLIKSIVRSLIDDPDIHHLMTTWFTSYFAPYRSTMEFQNEGQYWAYVKANEIRSLQGELMKSFEECEIANFLFLNSIPYQYERPYPRNTATKHRRQYCPDFHLTDTDIYIEHFALNAAGRTPPFIDHDSYVASIEWKRELHTNYKTILVETFSHEKSAGRLCLNLAEKLQAKGVQMRPLPVDQVFEILAEQGRINPFSQLVTTFLNHFKGGQRSLDFLKRHLPKDADRARCLAFLEIFDHIFQRYQAHLRRKGQIDFSDMITRATKYLENNSYQSPFGYILVDEFQDIAADRARFLKALLNNRPGAQLFAVGDDWQAIYRFTGSDISIMRDFADQFGETVRTDLNTTFRCVDQIAENAAKFVLANPSQLRKSLRAVSSSPEPCIHIGTARGKSDALLREALNRIAKTHEGRLGTPRVLLLGRYNHLEPENLEDLRKENPRLNISFMTVHRSKGSEADYVVVLGMNTGRYGFPSEIADDPIIDLVLAQPEAHPNAEERRLFYVALTRAKREVYLLASTKNLSSFVQELLQDGYRVTSFGDEVNAVSSCPRCIEGQLEPRKNGMRTFYGCSNYPYCEHTQPACPKCDIGLPLKGKNGFLCSHCQEPAEECPRCSSWLQFSVGKFGSYLRCVNTPPCGFTRKA